MTFSRSLSRPSILSSSSSSSFLALFSLLPANLACVGVRSPSSSSTSYPCLLSVVSSKRFLKSLNRSSISCAKSPQSSNTGLTRSSGPLLWRTTLSGTLSTTAFFASAFNPRESGGARSEPFSKIKSKNSVYSSLRLPSLFTKGTRVFSNGRRGSTTYGTTPFRSPLKSS